MAGFSGQVMKSVPLTMFSWNCYSILRRLQVNITAQRYRFTSYNAETAGEAADPAPLFFNEEIQKMLQVLTRPNLNKIFKVRKDGKPIADPTYKFMTDEELQEALKATEKRAKEKLQMPPVVKQRKPITEIISKDPALQGYNNCTYLFTDITYNVSNVDRLIVAREPNGLLRHANWDERFRMNQIYFPIDGRDYKTPPMFFGENLEDLLKREEYEFILDRSCAQFDPDDPDYHRITKTVYDRINENEHFQKLISTRHYGPMVFHLVWTKNIDTLLIDNIKHNAIEDAALLVQLYYKIHASAKLAEIEHDDKLTIVEKFAELDSQTPGKIKAAINAYKEIEKAREEISKSVKAAHGQ